jgi:hypothetical protein
VGVGEQPGQAVNAPLKDDRLSTFDLMAADLFEMWHEKTPDSYFTEELDLPEEVFGIGEITHIVYRSDKWEEPGNYIDYVHKFSSFPALYASNGSMFPDETEAYTSESTAKLLGMMDLKDAEYGFPVLAHVLALRWFDGAKFHKIKFKTYQPVMSCSIDQQTVVIFADETLFIHGGRMTVEADGIIY